MLFASNKTEGENQRKKDKKSKPVLHHERFKTINI
jgi:hypothetical protein